MATEKKIQAAAIRYADKVGVPSIRMVFRYGVRAGWPDVLFLIPGGAPLFIEFKSPGKKPTKLQLFRIRKLKELGYNVHVCDGANEAREKIAHYLEAAQLPRKSC
jgi:hypothetical protein